MVFACIWRKYLFIHDIQIVNPRIFLLSHFEDFINLDEEIRRFLRIQFFKILLILGEATLVEFLVIKHVVEEVSIFTSPRSESFQDKKML